MPFGQRLRTQPELKPLLLLNTLVFCARDRAWLAHVTSQYFDFDGGSETVTPSNCAAILLERCGKSPVAKKAW